MEKIQKVIIIGAPRSGTNILRDVLSEFDGICTWPCDEINYIWRYGNAKYPSDEIPVENARPKVKQFINQAFQNIADQYAADVVIEKTCANSLRVPFVDQTVPGAKYIFIYRDGIDVAGSARERWTARLDLSYILKKAMFVPRTELPYYALRYLWARFYRFFSKNSRLSFWGPALSNMQQILQEYSLTEVCALQWQACVEKAEYGLSSIPADRVFRISYEDLVQEPARETSRILKFLGKEQPIERIQRAVKVVSSKSLGKGRSALGTEEVQNLERLVGNTLKRYGY